MVFLAVCVDIGTGGYVLLSGSLCNKARKKKKMLHFGNLPSS